MVIKLNGLEIDNNIWQVLIDDNLLNKTTTFQKMLKQINKHITRPKNFYITFCRHSEQSIAKYFTYEAEWHPVPALLQTKQRTYHTI